MSFEKENFLRTKFVRYLQQLDPDTAPRWGKMSVQQMIEHFSRDAVRNANGRLTFDSITTPQDRLVRTREWLASKEPFKENTRHPLLPPEPVPLHFNTIQAAIGSLQEELIYFFMLFEKEPGKLVRNPIFGDLDFEQNVNLLYKHALHHLRQFGVIPMEP